MYTWSWWLLQLFHNRLVMLNVLRSALWRNGFAYLDIFQYFPPLGSWYNSCIFYVLFLKTNIRQNRKLWPKLLFVPQRTDLQISRAPLVKSDKSVAYKCLNISKEEQKEHDNIFESPFLARLSSTGTTPGARGLSSLGAEWWVPEIRNVMQSELSNRHARLIYLLQGCGNGRKRRQRDTTQCNVIRVKEPYPAKDDAIFSVLQIHHRWKRRKKKHNLSFCCTCECTFSSVFPLATNCPLCPIEESGCQSMTPALLHTQIGRPLNLKLLLLALHRYHPCHISFFSTQTFKLAC